MTSAVGVESVNQDIVAMATKATELFLMDFARRAYDISSSNVLDYDDIQELVHNDPRYDFLVDTTPPRIKFSEALKLIEANKREAPAQPSETPKKHQEDEPSKSSENEDKHDTSMDESGEKDSATDS